MLCTPITFNKILDATNSIYSAVEVKVSQTMPLLDFTEAHKPEWVVEEFVRIVTDRLKFGFYNMKLYMSSCMIGLLNNCRL